MYGISYNILSMSLTRTHVAFLGVISIFTGLIGPGTSAGSELLSYLMTDMRGIAYALLMSLILGFVLVALRKWSLYRLSVIITLIGVLSLWALTLFGYVDSMKTGNLGHGLSWGWIFFLLGGILMIISYRSSDITEADTAFSELVDTIIGMIGGFTLACIAGILILSSLSFFSWGQKHDILNRVYLSSEISSLSGGISTVGSYATLPRISYDRWADSLLTTSDTQSGILWKYMRDSTASTGLLKIGQRPLLLGDTLYSVDRDGYAYSWGRLLLGSRVTEWEHAILYKKSGQLHIVTPIEERTLVYTGTISSPIVISDDHSTLVWTEWAIGERRIVKNGIISPKEYTKIQNIALSPKWQDITILVNSWSERVLIKNDIILWALPTTYLSGSYKSNWSHSIFVTETWGIKKVVYDLESVSRDLQDIREIFLEADGSSYAYFGQPIGEEKYCLFTRYKGNICGLEGYMNPRFWADGGSILFAWKKDGVWSIYRNIDILIKNTGYTASSIEYDYVFFDVTNPRTYLFIEKDSATGFYRYRKNGNILPWVWKDVSTEVEFGYDNHILTAAEDETGWKILEL